jgi:hypothetical protein
MMHLTCTNMPQERLTSALDKCKEHGIDNILALRGDPPKGEEKFTQVEGGFACALDLVKFIRWAFALSGRGRRLCVSAWGERVAIRSCAPLPCPALPCPALPCPALPCPCHCHLFELLSPSPPIEVLVT